MRFLATVVLLVAGASARAAAYSGGDTGMTQHGTTSIGPRMTFFNPEDADHGRWAPGGQLRLHMDSAYVLEGSMDYVRYQSNGVTVHTTPIQATLIGFFAPNASCSPYLLFGGGWYPTRADGPYRKSRLFGPHAGAGLELILGPGFSLDGSYRFLWSETVSLSNPWKIFGTNFEIRGQMITIALNWRL